MFCFILPKRLLPASGLKIHACIRMYVCMYVHNMYIHTWSLAIFHHPHTPTYLLHLNGRAWSLATERETRYTSLVILDC